MQFLVNETLHDGRIFTRGTGIGIELSNRLPTRTRIEYTQKLMKMIDKLIDINVVSTKEGIIE